MLHRMQITYVNILNYVQWMAIFFTLAPSLYNTFPSHNGHRLQASVWFCCCWSLLQCLCCVRVHDMNQLWALLQFRCYGNQLRTSIAEKKEHTAQRREKRSGQRVHTRKMNGKDRCSTISRSEMDGEHREGKRISTKRILFANLSNLQEFAFSYAVLFFRSCIQYFF